MFFRLVTRALVGAGTAAVMVAGMPAAGAGQVAAAARPPKGFEAKEQPPRGRSPVRRPSRGRAADFGLTLSASPSPVRGGGLLGYTLTVWDAGPGAGSRTAELRVPDAVDVVGIREPGCAEDDRTDAGHPRPGRVAAGHPRGGHVVRCAFPQVAARGSRSVHILGIVRPDASGVLRARARLVGPPDRVALDDTAEADVPVVPGTDVAVRLAPPHSPRNGRTGNVVPVRVTVTDRGPRAAHRVTLNLGVHDADLVRTSGAHCHELRKGQVGRYFRCLLGRLRAGHARTVTAYLRRGRRAGTLAASAGLDVGDTRPADNAATVTLR
ncbi:hypothetical protein AB0J52_30055 [Spirillospora sp. NPDC049652]